MPVGRMTVKKNRHQSINEVTTSCEISVESIFPQDLRFQFVIAKEWYRRWDLFVISSPWLILSAIPKAKIVSSCNLECFFLPRFRSWKIWDIDRHESFIIRFLFAGFLFEFANRFTASHPRKTHLLPILEYKKGKSQAEVNIYKQFLYRFRFHPLPRLDRANKREERNNKFVYRKLKQASSVNGCEAR